MALILVCLGETRIFYDKLVANCMKYLFLALKQRKKNDYLKLNAEYIMLCDQKKNRKIEIF